jgi:hypothetical protein
MGIASAPPMTAIKMPWSVVSCLATLVFELLEQERGVFLVLRRPLELTLFDGAADRRHERDLLSARVD